MCARVRVCVCVCDMYLGRIDARGEEREVAHLIICFELMCILVISASGGLRHASAHEQTVNRHK